MKNSVKALGFIIYLLILVPALIYTVIFGNDPWNIKYVLFWFFAVSSPVLLIFGVYFLLVEILSRILPYGKKKKIRKYMKPPGRMIRIQRPLFRKEPKMNYSLLYPENVTPEVPDAELIDRFDRLYGGILPADFVSFCTRDPAVLRYREELFGELRQNKELCDALLSLAENLDREEDESPVITLKKKKALIRAARSLSGMIPEHTKSEALAGLREFIRSITDKPAFLALEKEADAIPDGEIRSLTVAVNLNENFYPTEIGVVSVSDSVCEHAEPLERHIDGAEESLNRAIMKAAEQVILRDLAKKRVKIRKLLKAELGISGRLGDEIRYAVKMAEIL
ncbi:MAG: hypothetical protein IKI93_03725 [Clostridia bacterium]|nr:hypothetical protein [Clostridia bacterium]